MIYIVTYDVFSCMIHLTSSSPSSRSSTPVHTTTYTGHIQTRQLNLWGFTRIVSDRRHDGGTWEREDFIRGKVNRLENITRVGIGHSKAFQLLKSKQMRRSTCSQEPTYAAAEEVLSVAQDDNTDTLVETEQLQREDESAYSPPKGLPKVIPLSSFPLNNNEMDSNNKTNTFLPTIPTSEIYASNRAVQTNHMQHETSSEDFDMSLNDSVQDQAVNEDDQAVNEDDLLLQLSSIFESREMDDLSSILSLNEDFRDPMISF